MLAARAPVMGPPNNVAALIIIRRVSKIIPVLRVTGLFMPMIATMPIEIPAMIRVPVVELDQNLEFHVMTQHNTSAIAEDSRNCWIKIAPIEVVVDSHVLLIILALKLITLKNF